MPESKSNAECISTTAFRQFLLLEQDTRTEKIRARFVSPHKSRAQSPKPRGRGARRVGEPATAVLQNPETPSPAQQVGDQTDRFGSTGKLGESAGHGGRRAPGSGDLGQPHLFAVADETLRVAPAQHRLEVGDALQVHRTVVGVRFHLLLLLLPRRHGRFALDRLGARANSNVGTVGFSLLGSLIGFTDQISVLFASAGADGGEGGGGGVTARRIVTDGTPNSF